MEGGGVLFYIGEIKNSAFFKFENFQKMLKNQWKIYNFWKLFRKFCDFFKFLSKFSRKFKEKFRKFWKYAFVGSSSKNNKNLVEKSMKTSKILKIFMNFYSKKLILIKIKASLMEFWKFLILLKERKKASGKFLSIWAQNQLRFEISEKILKVTKISMENWFCYPFSFHISGP